MKSVEPVKKKLHLVLMILALLTVLFALTRCGKSSGNDTGTVNVSIQNVS